MEIACLVNPTAGARLGNRIAADVAAWAARSDCRVRVVELGSQPIDEQMELAAACGRLIVAGGDGTVSSLLPHLINSEIRVGVMPLGTGNDLAIELGVRSLFSVEAIDRFMDAFSAAVFKPVSVWRLTCEGTEPVEILFCNYFSLGFDAAAVADFARWRQHSGLFSQAGVWGNRAGYALAAARNLSRPAVTSGLIKREGVPIHDLRKRPAWSLLFTNIKSVMGLGVSNPDSCCFDDQLELLLIDSVWNYLAWFDKGRSRLRRGTRLGSASSWSLSGVAPVPLQADGESCGALGLDRCTVELAGKVQMMVAFS